jgi:hypothetical protein
VNTGDRTTLNGVGNSCGGAFSVNDYVLFGADNIVGGLGCDTDVKVPEPGTAILLFGLAGLLFSRYRK